MTQQDTIIAFIQLGNRLRTLDESRIAVLKEGAVLENPWFTPSNVVLALKGLGRLLDPVELQTWASQFPARTMTESRIGIVMAGNIPLVGFHDLLCVLIAGHRVKAKLSSQDSFLMRWVVGELIDIEPGLAARIEWTERLDNIQAVIATGSDNTARYFEYYFRSIPRIIRRNRSSCALISSQDTVNDLQALATDVFSYFGLGCRNVSKLFLPEGFSIPRLFEAWESHREIIHHHKYANNYDYHKSVFLVNRTPFLDNGFVLLKEDDALVSPVSILYYEYYNGDAIKNLIDPIREKIQCIVTSNNAVTERVPFGQAQYPAVNDYADGVDTMAFLSDLR